MRRCLRERHIWLIHEGEGTVAQRAHLARCPSCTQRYSALALALETLRGHLCEAPVSVLCPVPQARPVFWRPPAVALLAGVLLLLSVSLWSTRLWDLPGSGRLSQASYGSALAETTAVFSRLMDMDEFEGLDSLVDITSWRAALESD